MNICTLTSVWMVSLLLIAGPAAHAQLPAFAPNYTHRDSVDRPLTDSFMQHYDIVLTYTEQDAGNRFYDMLACKDHRWTAWRYEKDQVSLILERPDGAWRTDTAKGVHFVGPRALRGSRVSALLKELGQWGFWTVSGDSLAQKPVRAVYIENGDTVVKRDDGWTDNTNYRFDVYAAGKRDPVAPSGLRVVESYYPEYFVKTYPYMVDRKRFIQCRDAFRRWWAAYGVK